MTKKAEIVARYRREIDTAQAKINSLQLLPDEDTAPIGTMVAVVVRERLGAQQQKTHLLLKVRADDGVAMWEFTGVLSGGQAMAGPNGVGWISFDGLTAWAVDHVEIESWRTLAPAPMTAKGGTAPGGVVIEVTK